MKASSFVMTFCSEVQYDFCCAGKQQQLRQKVAVFFLVTLQATKYARKKKALKWCRKQCNEDEVINIKFGFVLFMKH